MKTYYIVQHSDKDGFYWYAHKKGFWSFLGIFNRLNQVNASFTTLGPEVCLHDLRCILNASFMAIQKTTYEMV